MPHFGQCGKQKFLHKILFLECGQFSGAMNH